MAFLESLAVHARCKVLEQRANVRIPADVEFACVVGTGGISGDGIVAESSQWSKDLQDQGIPAYRVRTSHSDAMSNHRVVALLAVLVRTPQPRHAPCPRELLPLSH
jgi:hypothetical protein